MPAALRRRACGGQIGLAKCKSKPMRQGGQTYAAAF